MRILIINPNTSIEFTDRIQKIASKFASSETQITTMNPAKGPKSIECIYDELLSSPGTLELAINQLDNFDAFIIACYSDHPTIQALREITEKPVVGIAEASMHFACMIGDKFSIVTTNEEWEPLLRDAVNHYGLDQRCASVRSTRMPVLALESATPKDNYESIKKAAKEALTIDDAEVICLGCAGMIGLDKKLQDELGVPVLDGVICALKIVEGFITYNISTSKKKRYRQPRLKPLLNLPKVFKQGYT